MHTEELLDHIPVYLRPYVARQDPTLYCAIDQASWRFILKVSRAFFAKHAHQKYLDGLAQTGISLESIPLISDMDKKLRTFGWHAVAVTGFIPPAVFMEFLSLGILPIACDMRKLEHLAYTPAPDIVHEAAGHAPIIADAEYASYLRSYGEISRKAIFSIHDVNVYQAIRNLSDTKENPHATEQEISAAQEKLNQTVLAQTEISEATLLSRMGWWTFEYGLVGELSSPKIYGAGLLSSLGESYRCFDSAVKKVPFSISCIDVSYDITRPQPQLFVSPDFQTLKDTLEKLADQMAFRMGGMAGLQKALDAQTVTTTELDTHVQVSGILSEIVTGPAGHPIYLKFQGPTQLAYQDEELLGQGASYHVHGFGTPVHAVTPKELAQSGLEVGQRGKLRLTSGIEIEGELTNVLEKQDQIILLSFNNCRVTYGETLLFDPQWGAYDMVCGKDVVSVFGGAADRGKYLSATGGFEQDPGKQKSNLTSSNAALNELYAQMRVLRQANGPDSDTAAQAQVIFEALEKNYPDDWLLRYELLEFYHQKKHQASQQQKTPSVIINQVIDGHSELQAHEKDPSFLSAKWIERIQRIHQRLAIISSQSPEKKEMIERGLKLL